MQTKEHIPTNDFAKLLGVKGATVRRHYCVNGHYMGIKPVKMPNNRLLWPTSPVSDFFKEPRTAA